MAMRKGRESNEQITVTHCWLRDQVEHERGVFVNYKTDGLIKKNTTEIKKQCSPALLVTLLSLLNSPVLWFYLLPNWFQHGCRPGSCHWAGMVKAASHKKVGRKMQKEQRNDLCFLHPHTWMSPRSMRAPSSSHSLHQSRDSFIAQQNQQEKKKRNSKIPKPKHPQPAKQS